MQSVGQHWIWHESGVPCHWVSGQRPGTQKESSPMNMKHIAAAALAFTLALSATTVASARSDEVNLIANGEFDQDPVAIHDPNVLCGFWRGFPENEPNGGWNPNGGNPLFLLNRDWLGPHTANGCRVFQYIQLQPGHVYRLGFRYACHEWNGFCCQQGWMQGSFEVWLNDNTRIFWRQAVSPGGGSPYCGWGPPIDWQTHSRLFRVDSADGIVKIEFRGEQNAQNPSSPQGGLQSWFIDDVYVTHYSNSVCPGQVIMDGRVDGLDLAYLLTEWNTDGLGVQQDWPHQPYNADLNGDGTVEGADLGILLGGWGQCPCLDQYCPCGDFPCP